MLHPIHQIKIFLYEKEQTSFCILAGGVYRCCGGLVFIYREKGGDVLEIYRNEKLAFRQFIHLDKTVKTLSLASLNSNDKIDVYYSHCGATGKHRVLTMKDEKNTVLKEWRFPDASSNHSAMRFYGRDILPVGSKSSAVRLFYSAKELPEARLLVMLGWKDPNAIAKR